MKHTINSCQQKYDVLDLFDRAIAYNPAYVKLGIGVTGAVMLSQAVYWSKRTGANNEWFYKTQDEWESETGLTRREQETARKKMKERGILLEDKRGVPCKIWYKVDKMVLRRFVLNLIGNDDYSMAESAKLECTKAPYSDGGISQTITENTTEITTDIISLVSNVPIETNARGKKPDYIREIWNQYPEHRRGGTDQQLWKKWKAMRLTESDAADILNYLVVANESWRLEPRFVPGITKFIDEHRWKVSIDSSSTSNRIDHQDTSWAEDFDPTDEDFTL